MKISREKISLSRRTEMYILGISAFYHDSAAALLKDGKVFVAAEEERFTRIKHDNAFPFQAVAFCLREAGIALNDVEALAYYEKPLLKFERILDGFVQTYPFSLKPFLCGIPEWLRMKVQVERILRKELGFQGKIFFVPHHVSHAAAAFFPSPFKKAAVLTVDGTGEYQTTGLWLGERNTLVPLRAIDFPHSWGLFYSTFTSFLGFTINEDEYKVMGLAAYGEPSYEARIRKLIEVKADGSFRFDMRFFAFREGFRMWSPRFEDVFGQPRKPGDPITQREKDLAASVQTVLEDGYGKILRHLSELTGCRAVCVGGGVALNATANGKIFDRIPFTDAYVFGAAGDSGAAVGAALFVHHQLFGNIPRHEIKGLEFGSAYTDAELKQQLAVRGLPYEFFDDEETLLARVALLLSQDAVIGWFQGRMEFGPRALGARSILANPRSASMKEKVNRVKRREAFRPFGGSILQERVGEYLEIPGSQRAFPFMNFCFRVRPERREELAAIVHKDGTCRAQTVSPEQGRYYRLLSAFAEKTKTPCLLNTSFNTQGEPIVESPAQAIDDFLATPIDYLAIGNFLVSRPRGRGGDFDPSSRRVSPAQ